LVKNANKRETGNERAADTQKSQTPVGLGNNRTYTYSTPDWSKYRRDKIEGGKNIRLSKC